MKFLFKRTGFHFRNIANLFDALASHLSMFNTVAIDQMLTQKLIGYLDVAPDIIVPQIQGYFVRLIAH